MACATHVLAVAALAMIREYRFIIYFISDRATCASTGITFTHDFFSIENTLFK